MRKVILFSILTICLVLISEVKSFGQALPQQIEALNQTDNRTIKLFNDQNLEGWYTFLQNRGRNNDPKSVFTVMDGMIRISGEEWGCITTNVAYENFKLLAEFKWGEITFEPRIDVPVIVAY
jgi:hypothetical protein